MIVIHHLETSQSERVIWTAEELELEYRIEHHARDAMTRMAPPELARIHPLGSAPVIEDGNVVLAESGAILEYLARRHGGNALVLDADDRGFADYLYWFHFANGTLMLQTSVNFAVSMVGAPTDSPVAAMLVDRLAKRVRLLDARLAETDYAAGADFTLADVMLHFRVPQHPAMAGAYRRTAGLPACNETGGP
jgi:glutathione S-transferase